MTDENDGEDQEPEGEPRWMQIPLSQMTEMMSRLFSGPSPEMIEHAKMHRDADALEQHRFFDSLTQEQLHMLTLMLGAIARGDAPRATSAYIHGCATMMYDLKFIYNEEAMLERFKEMDKEDGDSNAEG